MFSLFIISYLFLGGAGAGLMTVSSVWALCLRLRMDRTDERLVVFELFQRRCVAVAMVTMLAAVLCLVFDLGRPDMVHMLFLRPTSTVLSYGTFFLAFLLASMMALAALSFLYIPRVRMWMRVTTEICCAIGGMLVLSYTGVFLYNVKAVPMWDTVTLPLLFVFSSLSMGCASCLFLAATSREPGRLEPGTKTCRLAHVVAVVLEAIMLAVFLAAVAFGRDHAPDSFNLLFDPQLSPWFWAGTVLCGLCIPLGAEVLELLGHSHKLLIVVELLCLVGGFSLRYCVVMAGIH